MGVVTEKIPGETKAQRKARKEQRKAEKLAAKASVGESKLQADAGVVPAEGVAFTDTDGGGDDVSPGPSKRKRGADEDVTDQPPFSGTPSSDPTDGQVGKSKKSKKSKKSTTVSGTGETSPIEQQGRPSSETTESTTTTGGPLADASLSEQAKKALHYAYLHSIHHVAKPTAHPQPGQVWKFNKARQNWLAKHWSDSTEVHDKYVDLVNGYLATTVGAARQNIINQAKQLRDQDHSTDVSETEPTESTEPEPTDETTTETAPFEPPLRVDPEDDDADRTVADPVGATATDATATEDDRHGHDQDQDPARKTTTTAPTQQDQVATTTIEERRRRAILLLRVMEEGGVI